MVGATRERNGSRFKGVERHAHSQNHLRRGRSDERWTEKDGKKETGVVLGAWDVEEGQGHEVHSL